MYYDDLYPICAVDKNRLLKKDYISKNLTLKALVIKV